MNASQNIVLYLSNHVNEKQFRAGGLTTCQIEDCKLLTHAPAGRQRKDFSSADRPLRVGELGDMIYLDRTKREAKPVSHIRFRSI